MGLADIALQAGQLDRTGQAPADIIEFIESSWGLNIRLYPVQRVILKAHYGLALDDNPWGIDINKPVPKNHPHYNEIAVLPDEDEEDVAEYAPTPDLVEEAPEGDPQEDGTPPEADPAALAAEEYQRNEVGHYKHRVRVTDWRRENVRYMTEAGYLRYLFEQGHSNIKEVKPGVQRRELVLSIGRRSGKTFMCACVVAYEVYKLLLKGDPQSFYGVPKTNTIGLISVATDKEQAGLLYTEASGHFSECAYFKAYTANNTMSYAKFQTPEDIKRYGRYADDPTAKATVKVSFKSCVAKGLRGAGNIVIILDELAHFNDAGQSDALKIYRAVKPSLAAFSPKSKKDRRRAIGPVEGRILSISSPLGKQGFFYTKFRQGFSSGPESRNMLCIQAPSWEVNPTLEATFLAEEYATDSTSFFTEYGADFSDRTRGWLEPVHLLACVDPRLRPATKAPLRAPHFMGIDISAGKSDGDYCAVAIGHLDDEGNIVLDLIERIRGGEGAYKNQERLSFDDITEWLYQLSRRFYISSGLFDQWAGLPFEMALHKKGLTQCKSVFFTKQLSSQVFQNFKDLMYERRLVLYDWPLEASNTPETAHSAHIAELLELQAEVQTKYLIEVQAPQIKGKYDDMSDALVRMVWEATQHLGKRKYIAGNMGRRSAAPGHAMSSKDVAKAQRKARAMSRLGGSSPDRQRSSINRGSVRGKR